MKLQRSQLVRCSSSAWGLLSRQQSCPCSRRPHSTRLFSGQHADPHQHQQRKLLSPTIVQKKLDWDDRIGIQNDQWTNGEKGWQVSVEWRPTPFGAGLFAAEDIAKDTILRVGRLGINLMEFQTVDDINAFCNNGSDDDDDDEYLPRLRYVKDYLWGFNSKANERGYDQMEPPPDRFFGMWVPGNGLNHHIQPNTVYRRTLDGIHLVALCDVAMDQELFDDYRRHGSAPEWLSEWSRSNNVTLNFADCNDFVDP